MIFREYQDVTECRLLLVISAVQNTEVMYKWVGAISGREQMIQIYSLDDLPTEEKLGMKLCALMMILLRAISFLHG